MWISHCYNDYHASYHYRKRVMILSCIYLKLLLRLVQWDLSMGLTPELSPIGRILIIFTMFAGRLGPLTIAFAITKRRKPDSFRHPKGNIMIG